jgi:hypothetical protein
VPIGAPAFEVPVADDAFDEAPWMRAGAAGPAPTASPDVAAEPPSGTTRAFAVPGRADSQPEAPKPAASGWLDLD